MRLLYFKGYIKPRRLHSFWDITSRHNLLRRVFLDAVRYYSFRCSNPLCYQLMSHSLKHDIYSETVRKYQIRYRIQECPSTEEKESSVAQASGDPASRGVVSDHTAVLSVRATPLSLASAVAEALEEVEKVLSGDWLEESLTSGDEKDSADE